MKFPERVVELKKRVGSKQGDVWSRQKKYPKLVSDVYILQEHS